MKKVYVVGSVERKFIVDRIYGEKKPAIAYCDRRQNKTFRWVVLKVPLGVDYNKWSFVHETKRLK